VPPLGSVGVPVLAALLLGGGFADRVLARSRAGGGGGQRQATWFRFRIAARSQATARRGVPAVGLGHFS
jgi:hypothetical protein